MYTVKQRLMDIKCAIADLIGDKTQPAEEVKSALSDIKEECENWLYVDDIKDGETVCEHGRRPFECGACLF